THRRRKARQMTRAKRTWKETTVTLASATATMIDGPGDDWLLVLRGTRARPDKQAARKIRPRRQWTSYFGSAKRLERKHRLVARFPDIRGGFRNPQLDRRQSRNFVARGRRFRPRI